MSTFERFDYQEIEGLRVGRWGKRINTACILYRIGGTLIDTGPPNQWRLIKKFLRERQVSQVLITHHHEDHGGNAGLIQQTWNAKVMAHSKGLQLHQKGFHVPFYRRLIWGNPKLKADALALPSRIELGGGLQLQSIPTPGHADDQVAFLIPQRGWLFTGDLYISAQPKYLRKVEDPNQEIESLRQLLKYDFDLMFCAHRGVVPKGKAALREKLNYLVTLREQVRHWLQRGDSLKEIASRLLGKEDFLYFFSLGDFSKRNFIEAFAQYYHYPGQVNHSDSCDSTPTTDHIH